jgi:hypothetical protein
LFTPHLLHLVQADQRACEWCSGFGSTALAILQAFFVDNEIDSDDACQEFVESALDNWAFLYREVYKKNGEVGQQSRFSPDL